MKKKKWLEHLIVHKYIGYITLYLFLTLMGLLFASDMEHVTVIDDIKRISIIGNYVKMNLHASV